MGAKIGYYQQLPDKNISISGIAERGRGGAVVYLKQKHRIRSV
jgi:hypothetical protein